MNASHSLVYFLQATYSSSTNVTEGQPYSSICFSVFTIILLFACPLSRSTGCTVVQKTAYIFGGIEETDSLAKDGVNTVTYV
jgi:hypothetical protein